jgi:hypothetical protein
MSIGAQTSTGDVGDSLSIFGMNGSPADVEQFRRAGFAEPLDQSQLAGVTASFVQ